MAERMETNPFASEDTNPHLPPSAYQPNPFPINPTEGNPWASSNANAYQQSSYQGHINNPSSYGHGYNTSSDGGTQTSYPTYIPMPSPSTYKSSNNSSYDYSNSSNAYNTNTQTYNPNAYNTNTGSEVNAYENTSQTDDSSVKNEYDNNTAELDHSATIANPGIETHDPDKLKISSQMLESPKSAPNKWRLLSRLIQFIASAGAFALIVAAQPATKVSMPVNANRTAIIFLYIVSVVSIIYSFGHLIFYCFRRWGHKNKAPRWLLMFIDAILGASFGTLMVFLIKDFRCKPGDLNGWCDFYNTSIFFTVLSFVTYAVSFIWDIVGGFKRS
ncbi:hypothetical protein RclHR1_00570002 [Rhizophagus clarus]|uniref:MARVEL domain-containing protein n=1 Tax=Rhizophagus clarus TaxID=94130 RepID=A0A2Z6RNS1_9GLOM|nr:hypothetical protein RclHR1_00570002 [Rhizophagus clarus]